MFRIFFICTGNRCRSPLAEVCLKKEAPYDWLEVHSAGTLDLGPAVPPAEMSRVAAQHGFDLSSHQARWLQDMPLAEADLVVGMALEHVAAAVVEGGAKAERAFTLTELVALLEELVPGSGDDAEARALDLIARAHELRSDQRRFVASQDIPDPIGGPRRAYEEVTKQIEDLCARLAARLFEDT